MPLPRTSNVTRPRAFGYDARLGDLYLRLAVAPDMPIEIQTAPLEAPRFNTAAYAVGAGEEIRNEFGQLYSRQDFSGGEGLDFAHKRNPDPLDGTRFWDSKHVDVNRPLPGKPAMLTLLAPTAIVDASAQTNQCVAYDGTALYVASGNVFRRSTNFTAATPTFTDDDPGSSTAVLDVTTLGADVYAAMTTNGIYKRSAGSWSHLASTITAVKVWGVKRLLVGATAAGVLQTVNTTTGAAVLTLASLANGDSWLDVQDCGAAILGCATDGSIYAFALDSSGNLVLKAQTLVGGSETPYCVGWDGVHVFYATREATPSGAICRVYRAEFDATNFLIIGAQMVRQFGDQSATVDYSPRRIIASRDSVRFGINEPGGSFLWRFDRSTGGMVRDLDLGASGTVNDLIAVSGRLFAAVAGAGLTREKVGSFEANGYIIGPLADFFYASKKSWAGAMLEADALTSDCRIELYYTTDPAAMLDPTSPAWSRVKNVVAGQDNTETPMSAVESRYLAGMVKMYANTGATAAPSVRSFTFRAYPDEGDVLVSLPVVVGDTIERPGHQRVVTRGLGDAIYAELKGKEGKYAELQLFRPAELMRGVVQQVGTKVVTVTDRGAVQEVSTVVFRGRRVTTTSTSDSPTAFAAAEFGVTFLGGREAA